MASGLEDALGSLAVNAKKCDKKTAKKAKKNLPLPFFFFILEDVERKIVRAVFAADILGVNKWLNS